MTTAKKVLLLEGIHQSAVNAFKSHGYDVTSSTSTLDGPELIEAIADVNVICIRSRTKLTKEVLENAKNLLAIGCFCIGTNQVDLDTAAQLGIPVFNSPYCNSRSVAELIIGQIINLSRKISEANLEMHSGKWNKSSKNRFEIRGKTVGIVGYGNIGSQLSVLAESLGMRVVYYDIVPKLALGNAESCDSLEELLLQSDFVTVHVPETKDTKWLFDVNTFNKMKPGSCFLNASRGSVVSVAALKDCINSNHIRGAYLDVYPTEPERKQCEYINCFTDNPKVVMTPHIGGATQEAQSSIGREVSKKLVDYVNTGSTQSSVNFPNISSLVSSGTYRVVNVHVNTPGVLKSINDILSEHNIRTQLLGTTNEIGYLIVDVDAQDRERNRILERVSSLEHSIKTRVLN